MATAMTTFGSTLSDLQKLTNDDRALDYSRANFQDDINARRLSDFLKARSEENRTKAQRDAEAARLLDAQQARTQQGSQFNTQQQNLMTLEGQRIAADKELQGMAGMNALEIAKLQSGQMDPRMFQIGADIEAENRALQEEFNLKKSLSDARRAAVREKNIMMGNKGAFDYGVPSAGILRRDDPRWTALNERISQLDAEAVKFGLRESPDGGYIIPPFTPIRTPAMFNQTPVAPVATTTPVVPQSGPLPFISTDSPAATRPTAPVRRFQRLPDGRTVVVP